MIGHRYVERAADVALVGKSPLQLTVIGGEPRPAYDRVHLSGVFDGLAPADLALTTRAHYRDIGVDAHFGDPVAAIDRDASPATTQATICSS